MGGYEHLRYRRDSVGAVSKRALRCQVVKFQKLILF